MSGDGMYAGISDPPGFGDDLPELGKPEPAKPLSEGAAKKAEILKWIIGRAEYYEACTRSTPPDLVPSLESVGRDVLSGRMDDATLARLRHLYRGQQDCRDTAKYLREIAAQIERDC